MNTIASTELQHLFATLLDVRARKEYAPVRVPPARHLPFDTLAPGEVSSRDGMPKGQSNDHLGRVGGRATRAAVLVAWQGLDQAVVAEGGTREWSHASPPVDGGAGRRSSLNRLVCTALGNLVLAGLPMDDGDGPAISPARQVRVAAGALVLTGVVLGYSVHPYFFGLSALVGAGLVFAGITDRCGKALPLSRTPQNQPNPF